MPSLPPLPFPQDVTRTKGNEFEDYFLKRELLMGIFEKVGRGVRGLLGRLVQVHTHSHKVVQHSPHVCVQPRAVHRAGGCSCSTQHLVHTGRAVAVFSPHTPASLQPPCSPGVRSPAPAPPPPTRGPPPIAACPFAVLVE